MNRDTTSQSPPTSFGMNRTAPDLNLAGAGGYPPLPDVASGSSLANMPTSTPPIPRPMPELSCAEPGLDVMQMGIDPTVRYFDLNLAGVDPLPNPPYEAPKRNMTNAPTFGEPDFSVPRLQPDYDLTAPGIDWKPPYGVDPALPDLTEYVQPLGTAPIVAASSDPLAVDPVSPDLEEYDHTGGLEMPGPLAVDPSLPDLEHPDLEQEVHMPDRPGELAADALAIMHRNPTYEQIPVEDYRQLWMMQKGNNATRERHLGMLMLGLDREEGGKVDNDMVKLRAANQDIADATGTDWPRPDRRGRGR